MRIHYKLILLTACLSSACGIYANEDMNSMDKKSINAAETSEADTTTAASNYSNPEKPIFVRAATPQFTIRLQSNPSTGYSWLLRGYDHNLLELLSHKYTPAQSQTMGAGGYEEWVFKAMPTAFLAPQATHLTMTYSRPWEADKGNRTRFTVVTE